MRTSHLLAAALALSALSALGALPAQAALAPNHQRVRELNAVLNHPGVIAAFGQSPIEAIEYVRTDFYVVRAGRCRVDVRIVGLPMPRGMAGARRFEVRPGRRVCWD
jgi:hypothetical protein